MRGQRIIRTPRTMIAGIGLAATLVLLTAGSEAAIQAEALLEALERGPGPSRGNRDAPVTIVEFSDFQCTFCRKFWPYHDRLFASAGLFAFTTRNLKRYAEALQLDMARFGACLDSERPREKVEQETIIGRAIGMTGTPGFLINRGRLIGAQPYEVFEEIIEGLLKEAGQRQPRKR